VIKIETKFSVLQLTCWTWKLNHGSLLSKIACHVMPNLYPR